MKRFLLLASLGLLAIGCGDDTQGPNAQGVTYSADGQPIYTLEDQYQFTLDGHDVLLGGLSTGFGKTNETAAALIVDTRQTCGMRLIVQKVGLTINDYTIKIGASDSAGQNCGMFRGNYTMTLTGEKTADITWISEDDETF